MQFNIPRVATTARSMITANSPELLVGTAILGVISTGILAAKGGYKARGIIDQAKHRKGLVQIEENEYDTYAEYKRVTDSEHIDAVEHVKLTWLCYAAPAVTGATSIASVLGLHTIHNRRHAALTGLYVMTSNKLDEVQTKAEELLGSKKTQELNNSTAQKAADKTPIGPDHEVVLAENAGRELCFDEWAGRWHNGSHAVIETAIAKLNEQLAEDGEVSLNDFYDYIGIRPNVAGETMGWSGAGVDGKRIRVELRFGSVSTNEPEPRPAISYRFHPVPKDNLGRS